MVDWIPRLQAEEAIYRAYVIRVAGAAAASITAMSEKTVQAAHDGYETMLRHLEAIRDVVSPESLEQVVRAGHTVISGADDLRQWFWREGRIKV